MRIRIETEWLVQDVATFFFGGFAVGALLWAVLG